MSEEQYFLKRWSCAEDEVESLQTRVKELEQELARMEKRFLESFQETNDVHKREQASQQQVRTLKKYARHLKDPRCLKGTAIIGDEPYRCTCGLDAVLTAFTPAKEESQFNKAGFSKHGCHYGTIYTRVVANDEVYDSEPCPQCEQDTSQQPEMRAVCPCLAWLLERKADNVPKVCLECFKLPLWRIFSMPEHPKFCTTPGCNGSGVIQLEGGDA